jgi:hypothetical protein
MDSRRPVPRHRAGWPGAVLIEDERAGVGWQECTVLDISVRGVGIAVRDGPPSSLVGHSVSIELPADCPSVSVRLKGVIKNALRVPSRGVRIGIEFARLSAAERAIATVLGALTELDATETMLRLTSRPASME